MIGCSRESRDSGSPLRVVRNGAVTSSLRGRLAELPARARRRPGAQPLDLASRQGDADFPDPFQLDACDRLGVEAREVDDMAGLAALDRLQIALAALQAHRGFLAIKARQRVPLVAIN